VKDNITKEYSLTIASRAMLSPISYILELAAIGDTSKWFYRYDPHTKIATNTCPAYPNNPAYPISDCNFTFKSEAEVNGYWDDARWRCGSAYVQCNKEEAKMNKLADDLKKDGCTELTCSKEINEMNGYVEEIARLHSYGVGYQWWTCWSTSPYLQEKGKGKYFTHDRKWRIQTTAEGDPKWGTLYGTRVWKDKEDDKQHDVACFNDPAKGKEVPSGFWPNYGTLGIAVKPVID
jgi:hypothetical protein